MRAQFGDWIYYPTSMRVSELAERVDYADRFVESRTLADLLQRVVRRKRGDLIAKYLRTESQRFIGAIIVSVFGGAPEWLPVKLDEDHIATFSITEAEAERLQETVGFLKLSGSEKLFALDGQHRLNGIKQIIANEDFILEHSKFVNEEVTVIFVAHKDTIEGKERTRRLFTTLNRTAKAITLGERIALDEDDACAIITRNLLLRSKVLMDDTVAPQVTGQLAVTDKNHFTAVAAIYNCCKELLLKRTVSKQVWVKPLLIDGRRPSDNQIEELELYPLEFFDALLESSEDMLHFIASSEPFRAAPYRNANGGSVLFRPAGLETFASAVREYSDVERCSIRNAVKKLASANLALNGPSWNHVMWGSDSGKMEIASANRNVSKHLLLRECGVILDEVALLEQYRKILDNKEATLPA